MQVIEIPVPAHMLATGEQPFTALEAAAVPEVPVPEIDNRRPALTEQEIGWLSEDILGHIEEHDPAESFRRQAATTLDYLRAHPDDTLARATVGSLRSFVLCRPIGEVLGPQPPFTAEQIPRVEPTFVASVRRGDAEAVQLLGSALGEPAVAAICAKHNLDLQWMHARAA